MCCSTSPERPKYSATHLINMKCGNQRLVEQTGCWAARVSRENRGSPWICTRLALSPNSVTLFCLSVNSKISYVFQTYFTASVSWFYIIVRYVVAICQNSYLLKKRSNFVFFKAIKFRSILVERCKRKINFNPDIQSLFCIKQIKTVRKFRAHWRNNIGLS